MLPPRSKLKRALVAALALFLGIGVLAALKVAQISTLMAMGKQAKQAGPPPEAVGSALARSELWERTLSAVGTVEGVRGVELSSDAPGRVIRIRFDSGDTVKRGQILAELDSGVERAQLASAKAHRDLAELTAQRTRALVERNSVAPAQLDNDQAQLAAANKEVAALEATVERKIIRAPFDGRLGIRLVDLGQFLNPGTPITVLESTGGVFVDFRLPQQGYGRVEVGMPVRVVDQSGTATADGVISAVEPKLDEPTRSLKLRASLPNQSEQLRPGMFVSISVLLPARDPVVTIPGTAVVRASYGDSVFIVEDKPAGSPGMDRNPEGKPVKLARQQFVRLGETRGDFVAVTEGVKPDEAVVSAGAFKLRNGAPIVISDGMQPKSELHPHPENR